VRERDLQPFRLAAVEFEIRSGVEDCLFTGADAVLIFGGDGTVHRHLGRLHAAQVPALVVPVGSGNDFAIALGLKTARQSLVAWQRFAKANDNSRSIDLGEITAADGKKTLYCCVAGAGLDSAANQLANRMPRWLRARGGYLLAAFISILRFRPAEARVAAQGANGEWVKRSGPATLVAFANAPAYGGGLRIAPRAQLDDGLLDLCFVRRASRLRLMRKAPDVLTGSHLLMPEVEYAQVRGLTLATDPPLPVYADGEYVCPTPVQVRVLPRALQVIVAPA